MENKFIPVTNFYKGYCIAYEIINEGGEVNSRGQVKPRERSQVPVIINEQFEKIKLLRESARWWGDSGFNKYGQVIVTSSQRSSSFFVMDYTGRHIIAPSKFENRIKEVVEGLYEVQDYSTVSSKESKDQNNYYNQNGEKLLKGDDLNYFRSLFFKEGKEANYLWYDRVAFITLDKQNNILKRY